MVSRAMDELKLDMNVMMEKRVKRKILRELEGDYKEDYAKLWDYAEELRQTNPGTTVEVLPEEHSSMFGKFYVCFAALKQGWRTGCRPILGLDGCFLKTFCRGELLIAVGRDANNQRFPVAWAIVKSETKANWIWFLQHLQEDLGINNGNGLAIISDMQKVN